jgi:hypothetical protein
LCPNRHPRIDDIGFRWSYLQDGASTNLSDSGPHLFRGRDAKMLVPTLAAIALLGVVSVQLFAAARALSRPEDTLPADRTGEGAHGNGVPDQVLGRPVWASASLWRGTDDDS